MVLLAVISAFLTATNAGSVSAEDSAGAVILRADGIKWDAQMIDAEPGETLRLLIKNDDPVLHTFTVYDLGIDEKIGPWEERLVVIEAQEGRIYGFICRIEDHKEDMSGAIVVR